MGPGDSLDRTRSFARISQSLFGRGPEAPKVGRFFLLEEVGRGGMGVVYAAFDPVLGRKVALKLLHNRQDSSDRLLVEGRMLANLEHPNVVTVHEVGTSDRGVYLAMSFIEGRTLSSWIVEEEPGWRELLRVFVDAGRGLAAVHAAGVAHCDVKPTNVVIGDDAIVRVVDFGLAIPVSPDEGRREGLAGTRGYMAPELERGDGPSAAADQYAYCVSLFEALLGRKPALEERADPRRWASEAAAYRRGAAPPLPVFEAVGRGLAASPGDRFADMSALIGALEATLGERSGWRWLAAAVVIASVSAAVAVGWSARELDPCAAVGSEVEAAWNEGVRRGVGDRQQLHAPSVAGALAWSQNLQGLDDYAAAWSGAREKSCRAYHEGRESASRFDARTRCLTRLLHQLDAFTATLSSTSVSDALAVREAVQALDQPESCEVPPSLLPLSIEPADAAELRRAEEELAVVQSAWQRKRLQLPLEPELLERIRRAVDDPSNEHLRAEGYRLLATEAATVDEQLPLRRAALRSAVANRASQLLPLLFIELADGLHRSARTDQAVLQLELADAAIEALERLLGEHPPLRELSTVYRAMSHDVRALIARDEQRLTDNRRHAAAAVRTWGAVDPPRPLYHAYAWNNLGETYRLLGRYAAGAEALRRAIELASKVLDSQESLLMMRNNLGASLQEMGRFEEAKALLLQSRGTAARPTRGGQALASFNLAIMDAFEGRPRQALARCEEAAEATGPAGVWPHPAFHSLFALHCAAFGRELHPDRVSVEALSERMADLRAKAGNDDSLLGMGALRLGTTLAAAGRLDDAERALREAIEHMTLPGGTLAPDVAHARYYLGRIHAQRGEPEAARREHEAALALLVDRGFTEHPAAVGPLVALAEYEPARARERLAQARRIVEVGKLGPRPRAWLEGAEGRVRPSP